MTYLENRKDEFNFMPTLSTIIKKEISIFQIGKLWPSRLRIIDSLQNR